MKKEVFNPEFWLNVGLSHEQLGEYTEAINSYIEGITLAPERADGYLMCAKAYMSLEDFDQALKTCDVGITYAEDHRDAPWANRLKKDLEAGKTQVAKRYTQSEYGTFSS